MTKWVCPLLIVVFFVALPIAAGAEEPEDVLGFAKHLYDQGDYYRAVTEAKRFLFLQPDGPKRHEARFLIASAYLEAGQYEQARGAFAPVIEQTERPDLAADGLLGLGKALENSEPAGDVISFYQQLIESKNLPRGQESEVRNVSRMRLGWLLLDQGRWLEAQDAFNSVDQGHQYKLSAAALAHEAPEGANLSYKSPRTAGALSAVLPGAGQLYVGRPVDAGLAFGLNAAFIIAAVESYNSENWGAFAVLSFMEIGWYGGNIYNAVNGAHIHNREVKEDYLKKLKRDHGWTVGLATTGRGPALALAFRF